MSRASLGNVRSFITMLCIQGFYTLSISFVFLLSFYIKNQFAFLLFSFDIFVASILWVLLVWGFWTFKTWAYWVALVMEIILLLQGIFSFWLPQDLPLMNAEVLLAPVCIIYLIFSRKVRTAFFVNNARDLPEDERRGISPHLFE